MPEGGKMGAAHGFTLKDGKMRIIVDDTIDVDKLADKIDEKLGGTFTLKTSKTYADYIETKKRSNNDSNTKRAPSERESHILSKPPLRKDGSGADVGKTKGRGRSQKETRERQREALKAVRRKFDERLSARLKPKDVKPKNIKPAAEKTAVSSAYYKRKLSPDAVIALDAVIAGLTRNLQNRSSNP